MVQYFHSLNYPAFYVESKASINQGIILNSFCILQQHPLNSVLKSPKGSSFQLIYHPVPLFQLMYSLKEATVVFTEPKRGLNLTPVFNTRYLRISWKSINWQIFTGKKETKLLVYEPIELRNTNSSDSTDDICMEVQNPCKVQLFLEDSFASFIQLRERGKHSRHWMHIAQSHENKTTENPEASNFSTWDTIANTTVDKAHSSQ